MFGVSKPTACSEVHHVIAVMDQVLREEVSWPTDDQLAALCQMHMFNVDAFGSVDATVHRIERPSVNQRDMYNGYKKMHCLKTQYVCAPNGFVLHVSTGWRGAMADK
jgi:hypothetical protein